MIEIARFSGWPYVALVFQHDLFLHMSIQLTHAATRAGRSWSPVPARVRGGRPPIRYSVAE